MKINKKVQQQKQRRKVLKCLYNIREKKSFIKSIESIHISLMGIIILNKLSISLSRIWKSIKKRSVLTKMDYTKVFRSQIKLICNECNHAFILNKDYIRNLEIQENFVPLKARSSSKTMICPECNSTNFRVFYNYQNLYRRRCPKCGKMFETEESWKDKCDNCVKKHAELMASMGSR